MEDRKNVTIEVSDVATKVFENILLPFLKETGKFVEDSWNEFLIESGKAFADYMEKTRNRYSKIRTILYRTEPQPLYDFFECPDLRCGKERLNNADVDTISAENHFIIIHGTGGIGKTTFMKHLLMDALMYKRRIPIYIEWRELNSMDDKGIQTFLNDRLISLGLSLKEKYLEYALKSGCFLFLLDGYDELLSDKKQLASAALNDFSFNYPENVFVVTSRPTHTFLEFENYLMVELCPLSKKQAVHMVRHLRYDEELSERFAVELEARLYEKHNSFASNPLLLTIMLMTYEQYAEIPEKLHLFYAKAFDTLYFRHYAKATGKFGRIMASELDENDFKSLFAKFCFHTYYQGKQEFTEQEIIDIIRRITGLNLTQIRNFLYDLKNAVCVLYQDGDTYGFTHRSFQEYFTAVFLKQASDKDRERLAMALVQRDMERITNDNVLYMLKDMAPAEFEQSVLLPLVCKFEESYSYDEAVFGKDKYDFYFEQCGPCVMYSTLESGRTWSLIPAYSAEGKRRRNTIQIYFDKTERRGNKVQIYFGKTGWTPASCVFLLGHTEIRAYWQFMASDLVVVLLLRVMHQELERATRKYVSGERDEAICRLLIPKKTLARLKPGDSEYSSMVSISVGEIMRNRAAYALIKESHIGTQIALMADLKRILQEKQKARDSELDLLLEIP